MGRRKGGARVGRRIREKSGKVRRKTHNVFEAFRHLYHSGVDFLGEKLAPHVTPIFHRCHSHTRPLYRALVGPFQRRAQSDVRLYHLVGDPTLPLIRQVDQIGRVLGPYRGFVLRKRGEHLYRIGMKGTALGRIRCSAYHLLPQDKCRQLVGRLRTVGGALWQKAAVAGSHEALHAAIVAEQTLVVAVLKREGPNCYESLFV